LTHSDAPFAAAKAARREQNGARYAVASVFELPLMDASADAVVNIFAPCAEAEFCRVLRPQGHLILVGAGENHLMGLKQALYDDPYQNSGRADLPAHMTLVKKETLSYGIAVEGQDLIQALFSMTPYYWRTSPKDREKLTQYKTLETQVEFDIFVYRKDSVTL
jgi:23S rRNA (guanine745-N1)-methyltransferase